MGCLMLVFCVLMFRISGLCRNMSKTPLTVCITGAAGQIGYALLPHICSGKTFGPDQPIILHLLDLNIEGVQVALGGVKMELEDSTYPLLKGVVTTGDAKVRVFSNECKQQQVCKHFFEN